MDRQVRFSLLVAVVVIVLACVCVFTGNASDGTPEGLFSWYDETINATCYVWPDGSGDCYCACEGEECVEYETPDPPTPTPVPDPDPDPVDPTKEACNRGLGNGSEDCDPGNSGGKPGAAGEDNE